MSPLLKTNDHSYYIWLDGIERFCGLNTDKEYNRQAECRDYNYKDGWDKLNSAEREYVSTILWYNTCASWNGKSDLPSYTDFIYNPANFHQLFNDGISFFNGRIPRIHMLIRPWNSYFGNICCAALNAIGEDDVHLVLDYRSIPATGKPVMYDESHGGKPRVRCIKELLGAYLWCPDMPGTASYNRKLDIEGKSFPYGFLAQAEDDYPRVEIYMNSIEETARGLCSPEVLFSIVMYHELVHAMHVSGRPIDGHSNLSYAGGTVAFREWLAQSVTWLASLLSKIA